MLRPTPRPFALLSSVRFVSVLLLILAVMMTVACVGRQKTVDHQSKPWKTWRPGGVPQGDGPGQKPDDWFYRQRAYPFRDIPDSARNEAALMAATMRKLQHPPIGMPNAWVQRGPLNIHGRITSIAASAADPDLVYSGTANGGVWKSENGGDSWKSIFDSQPTLAIGAVAMDPDDPDTIYVGTGEANASGDSYPGQGVFKSTDGGNNWDYIGLGDTAKVSRIAIDPTNPQRVFAATMGRLYTKNAQRGLYRSEDGGTSWTQVLFVDEGTGASDVAINPANPNIMYAATWERIRTLTDRRMAGPGSGVHKSVDGGTTWARLGSSEGLPAPSDDTGRVGLALCATSPDFVYVYWVHRNGGLLGFYRSADAGESFARRDSGLGGVTSSFGWYFGQVRVDPSNPNRVFALGLNAYRSTNGGTSWNIVGSNMHVDHHAMWISPDGSRIYAGNDGGFYRSTNGGGSFVKHGKLPITQFYAITVDPQQPHRIYGGTQDNGTLRTATGHANEFQRIFGGDGFYTIVDPSDSNTIYAEFQFGGLAKSTNGGQSFFSALSGVSSGDRRNWSTPVVMSPHDPDTLFYGTYRLYRTTNGAQSWSSISSDLTQGEGTITTIGVSPTDPGAILVGTSDGNAWITTNGGGTWANVTAGLPNRYITRVVFDPQDPATVYVTLSGYGIDEWLPHVFRSSDGGSTWSDIASNLPPLPINDLVVHPADVRRLFVGTDAGVFATHDGGVTWAPFGAAFPNAAVHDLHLDPDATTLFAGTHGRSVLTFPIPDAPVVSQLDLKILGTGAFDVEVELASATPVVAEVFGLDGTRLGQLTGTGMRPGVHRLEWDFAQSLRAPAAGERVLLRVQSGEQTVVLPVIVGPQPSDDGDPVKALRRQRGGTH